MFFQHSCDHVDNLEAFSISTIALFPLLCFYVHFEASHQKQEMEMSNFGYLRSLGMVFDLCERLNCE